MALELIQIRFTEESGAGFYEKLADCLVNQGLFIGPAIERAKAFDASKINITVSQEDNVQTFSGKHPNDCSYSPIYWLINYMTKRGVSFQAGEAIITGSYCGIVEIEFNKRTTVNYEGLGEYQVIFKQK